MKEKYFQNLYEETVKKSDEFLMKFNRISWYRMISFFAFLLLAAISLYEKNVTIGFLAFLFLFLFAYLLQMHKKIMEQKEFYENQKEVLGAYLARFDESWQSFPEDGSRFLQEDIPHARDLDLLGQNSLYQYLCVAHTPMGQKELAETLLAKDPQYQTILEKQKAIAELAEKETLWLPFQSYGKALAKLQKNRSTEKLEDFLQEVETKNPLEHGSKKWLSFLLPFCTLTALLLAVVKLLPYGVFFGIFIVQGLYALWCYRKNSAILAPLFAWQKELAPYQQILLLLEKENWQCDLLQAYQKELQQNGGAACAWQKLSTAAEMTRLRYNPLCYLPAFFLLLWENHCTNAFLKWRMQYGLFVRSWLQIIGHIETLMSLAVLYQVKEEVVFPTILSEETPFVQGENIKHPLLQEKEAVGNPVNLQAETAIITGSNMSGKTTYLRSIGSNLCLAYAGAPVCAKAFAVSCMQVFTSMRITDDVNKGISTFYAELLRIKSMVTYSKNQKPMICLIDEIFKGTNSADRIVGAEETIKKLSRPWCITVVSTHDFELCQLGEKTKIKLVNYHFHEYYQEDQIYFSYQLQNGMCQTTNARYLLKLAGILTEE